MLTLRKKRIRDTA